MTNGCEAVATPPQALAPTMPPSSITVHHPAWPTVSTIGQSRTLKAGALALLRSATAAWVPAPACPRLACDAPPLSAQPMTPISAAAIRVRRAVRIRRAR
jgi:hypothetical protein